MDSKVCTKCLLLKCIEDFPEETKRGKRVRRAQCKLCRYKYKNEISYPRNKDKNAERGRKYVKENREYVTEKNKQYRKENEEWIKGQAKIRYEKNKEVVKEQRKQYYRDNKEKVIAGVNDYVDRNKEKVRSKQRDNHNNRKLEDHSYRILKVLRSRLWAALKNKAQKAKKTKDLIGCSMSELMAHLESQFVEGMCFQNYGEWHIDHKIPCASFDFKDVEQQKQCFHFTNLQPLWAIDNLKKGGKIL